MSSTLETFTRAVASLHAAGNLVDELGSTVVLADMWIAAGRPSTARRLYLRAPQVSEAHGEPVLRATPDLHVGLSEMDYEIGDLEAARRHLERAAALGEGAAMTDRFVPVASDRRHSQLHEVRRAVEVPCRQCVPPIASSAGPCSRTSGWRAGAAAEPAPHDRRLGHVAVER